MVVQNGISCIRSHGLVEDSKTVSPQFETLIRSVEGQRQQSQAFRVDPSKDR